ncbi:MAG: outer membrane lipoprotein carrier protein LolA [Gemmatimonadetes bacterium]|nr:outer membrane lipoprotein carrier protein LolA [Gemmatimonadota bacterium]
MTSGFGDGIPRAPAVGRHARRPPSRAGRRRLATLMMMVCASSRLTAQDAGAILDRAVAAYGNVTTLRADFVQKIHDPMLGSDDVSRGEFLQQRPDRFAMRWREPSGDLIVADGQTLWVFLPSSAPNQVVRTALTGRAGESGDLVAEFLDRPRDRFTVAYERAEGVGGRAADALALAPRDRNAGYRRVLIWVDRQDNLVRQVEIAEASGAVRRITFSRLRVNQPIPASTFTFRPPAGARVVDATH